MKTLTVCLFALSAACAAVHAQYSPTTDLNITSTSSTVPNLKTTGNGGVLFGGTHGTGSIPATGASTRLMWYPAKAAFRVGLANGTDWDDANIGDHSIGLGSGSKATGFGADAIGSSWATGHQSFAGGWGSLASGDFSAALCVGTASNTYSFAAGMGTASGFQSTALGGGLALGNYSTSIGVGTTAVAVNSTVVGQYNELVGSTSAPAATDPIFVVGTGTSTSAPKNGFVVCRNGDVKLGKLQGDISGGDFYP